MAILWLTIPGLYKVPAYGWCGVTTSVAPRMQMSGPYSFCSLVQGLSGCTPLPMVAGQRVCSIYVLLLQGLSGCPPLLVVYEYKVNAYWWKVSVAVPYV